MTTYLKYIDSNLFPLHLAQENVYFDQLIDPKNTQYNVGCYFVIEQRMDVECLKMAFSMLLAHADALCLKIKQQDDGSVKQQVKIVQDSHTQIDFLNFSQDTNPKEMAINWMQMQFSHVFDIEQGECHQLALLQLEQSRFYFFTRFHHIVNDSIGTRLFFNYLFKTYFGLLNHESVDWLVDLPQYREQCEKSQVYLTSKQYQKDKCYWHDFLMKHEVTRLPRYYPAVGYQIHQIILSKALTVKLRALCASQGVSLLSVLLSTVGVYFSNCTAMSNMVVSTSIHCRKGQSGKLTVGMHANDILLSLETLSDDSFIDLLAKANKSIMTGAKHAHFPKSHVSRLVSSDKVLNADISLNYEFHTDMQYEVNYLSASEGGGPLAIRIIDYIEQDQLRLRINYQRGYFNQIEINRLADTFLHVMMQSVDETTKKCTNFDILSKKERSVLLYEWDQTAAPVVDKPFQAKSSHAKFPQKSTLQQLFEAQVEHTPNNIALVFAETQLTYRELNQQANQLAHCIRFQYQETYQTSLKPDSLIALYLDRSLEMVVSILAVLKAGGAYVPIAPDYPQARTVFMLADTGALILLTQNRYLARLAEWVSELDTAQTVPLFIATDDPHVTEGLSVQNLGTISTAEHLAYVIYTSGTTGQPKGVMVEQRSVVNRLHWMQSQYPLSLSDVVLQKTPYIFDVSVWELLWANQVGACLVVAAPEIHTQPLNLIELVIKTNITILHFVPAMLNGFSQALHYEGKSLPSSIKHVFCSGEALTVAHVDSFWKINRANALLSNLYGPTEATIDVTYFDCSNNKQVDTLPIGKAINNTKLYLLNSHHSLVPIGMAGELYIGGAGLARGYLNRDEITAERFIDNFFATAEDIEKGYTRLYQTGDLVRYLPDGNLEYLGRCDNQVKIRGYRIELGEIESALCQLEGIKQAVVIDRVRVPSQDKVLAAYLLSASMDELDIEAIRSQLSAKLPDYMQPATFTLIDQVPLTLNGKLDRQGLPEPEYLNSDLYVAPRNEMEQQLCVIWQGVLRPQKLGSEQIGVEQIGIHDNFFRIGGDSIISIQLVSRLRRAGYQLQIKELFDSPTIAQLSKLLSVAQSRIEITAEQERLTGAFALLPIQQWFFDQSLVALQHFNQSFMQQISGKIELDAIHYGLNLLAQQHDMLRVNFLVSEGGHDQVYTDNTSMAPLQTIDISAITADQLDAQLTKLQAELSIDESQLWQVVHLTGYEDGTARLCFIFHHLIIDAVSWRIIADDMQQVLTGGALPAKTSSYRQWIGAVTSYAEQHQAQRTYWLKQLGIAAEINYPALAPLTQHNVVWTAELTTQLLRDAPQGYYTEINDLLLSALGIALSQTFNTPQVAITLEGHGREHIDESIDTTRTVGWFTTLFPIILSVKEDVGDVIIETKERLHAIVDKGIGFGALGLASSLNSDFNDSSALPPVSFNYLGQMGSMAEKETDQQGVAQNHWQLTSEPSGLSVSAQNQDLNLLNINGAIIEGQLRFYIASQLDERLSQVFVQAFEQALIDVVNVATRQAAQGGLHTPSDHLAPDLSIERLAVLQSRFNIEAIFQASSLQQGFIYHVLSQADDDAYRVQLLLDYHCALNIDCYKQAWRLASLRYPALRMAFDWSGEPLQIITRGASVTDAYFSVVDLSHLSEVQRDEKITEIQQQDRKQGFDLTQPGLLRFTLIKHHQCHYTVMKTEHHSVSDGWSGPVLLEYVNNTYQLLVKGEMPKVEVDSAYIDAQTWLAKQQSAIQAYWQTERKYWLGGNDINHLFSRKADLTQFKTITSPQTQTLCVEGESLIQLKAMSREQGVTLNVALQFAWHKLLQIYTGDEQTIVGITVSGRDMPVAGIESSVGLYINTLPLVVNWIDGVSCAEVLQQIQHGVAQINSHSGVSLASLQTHGKRLFHSLLVFENYPEAVNKQSAAMMTLRKGVEKMDYPLSLIAYESATELVMTLSYEAEYIDPVQGARLLDQLSLILTQISRHPTMAHQVLSVLSDEERHILLHTWNQTEVDYPRGNTLQQLFEAQVDKTPNNIALVFEKKELTYSELNQKANKLAHHIRSQYQEKHQTLLKPDTLIALYLDRSLEMVISILAVLKAGGAYVPIAPEYPKARTMFMFEDSNAPFVITQAHYQAKLREWFSEADLAEESTKAIGCEILLANDERLQSSLQATHNPMLISQATDLAYVIYTSGSTGQPKGVMVEQRSVINRLHWMQTQFPLNPADVVLQKTPYSFDVSVWEFLWAHQVGASLVLALPYQHNNPIELTKLITARRVTTLHFVPSMLDGFNLALLSEQQYLPSSIQQVFCSGEALTSAHLENFQKVNSLQVPLANLYGPTEAAIDVTYFDCPLTVGGNIPPIGKPIDNIKLYVLNSSLMLVPIGSVGELYIGGVGVARGYLNRDELTTECFIDNTFATDEDIEKGDTRLYKTGDVVRYLPDGNLEYLGRCDSQVKIRGHRIELGEIEAALSSHAEINQLAVVAKENKDGSNTPQKYLVAYYVSDHPLSDAALVDYLTQHLPDYLLPSAFVRLDVLPLTFNGKLDQQALPNPTFNTYDDHYQPPITALENELCDIWQSILKIKRVGITDDFFRIGGDSILSISIVAEMKHFGLHISVRDIFLHRSISKLLSELPASTIKEIPYQPFSLIKQDFIHALNIDLQHVEDIYPTSYLQMGMLLEGDLAKDGTYHDVFSYQINCTFEHDKAINILQALVDKHALLRTSFINTELYGFLSIQHTAIDVNKKFFIKKEDRINVEHLITEERLHDFNLAIPGLFRFIITALQANSFTLIFSFHHCITDGWSVALLVSEFIEAYGNDTTIHKDKLPFYGECIQKEQAAINDKRYKIFWTAYLSDHVPIIGNLRLDNTATPVADDSRNGLLECTRVLTKKQNELIFYFAKKYNTSIDTIFISLYQVLLSTFFGTSDITIGLVVNNRLEKAGGDRLFGLHLNTIPLRQQLHSTHINVLFSQTLDEKMRISEYQIYPYGKIKADIGSIQDLYQCAFNYVHFHVLEEQQKKGDMTDCFGFEKTNIPLTFQVIRTGKVFSLCFKGIVTFIDNNTMQRLSDYLIHYLDQLILNKSADYELKRIPEPEVQQVLFDWNQTDKDYPQDKTLYQLFEEQVRQTPDNIALVFEANELTYFELNQRANQLAHHIRAQYENRYQSPLTPDTLIALYLDRSLEMVISILAVLKAGGAYVPIAHEYPRARTVFILQDTQVPFVITQAHYQDQLTDWMTEAGLSTSIIEADDTTLATQPHYNPVYINQATNLAYVIYTSGTTGQPKGVMIEHRGVVNLAIHNKNYYGLKEHESVLLLSQYIFDVSVELLFMTLIMGHKLIVIENGRQYLECIINTLEHNVIDHFHASSSVIRSVPVHLLKKVKRIVSGGEVTSISLIEHTDSRLINSYGPTEITVTSHQFKCERLNTGTPNSIPIGKGVANTRSYVLDDRLQLLPVGTVGELYIGGAGVARGYLNRNNLTAERFIDNPFATAADIEKGYTRLYKTGDLVRYSPDGNLEYLGRLDGQVKIRGYRIELGEIESALCQLDGIKQGVVIDKENDNGKYLTAYYVLGDKVPDERVLNRDVFNESTAESVIDFDDILRRDLSQVLPDHMVPSSFTQIDRLPLTFNGKLDRKGLPEPELTSTERYVAPRNDIEKQLSDVWQAVLGLNQIGIYDNFFRIGGDSITAIRLNAKGRQLANIDIPLALLFAHPTIAQLAVELNKINKQQVIMHSMLPQSQQSEYIMDI